MMLQVAFHDCSIGVYLFSSARMAVCLKLRRLQSQIKIQSQIIRDLLFADDCALLAHTEAEAQELFERFSGAARRSVLSVSLKKTEVMLQPASSLNQTAPKIMAGSIELKVVSKFCYLGSVLSTSSRS